MRTNDAQIVLRLPAELVGKIDQAAREMSLPGSPVTRAGVVRIFILRALESKSKRDRRRAGRS